MKYQDLSITGRQAGSDKGCLLIACSECSSGLDLTGSHHVRLEHRNLANIVSLTDINCLTALEWAIEVVRVNKIVIQGHYDCKVVEAAMDRRASGISGNWVNPITRIVTKYSHILAEYADANERIRRLCELNVLEQAANVCLTGPVRKAWEQGSSLVVQARIYDAASGLTSDLDLASQSRYDNGAGSPPVSETAWFRPGEAALTV